MERRSRGGYPLLSFEERMRLRWARAEIVRSKTQKPEPRVGRPARGSSIPEETLRAAQRSFRDGATLTEIADSLWRDLGFSSPSSCLKSLSNGLKKLSE